jgi:hypothetical protein
VTANHQSGWLDLNQRGPARLPTPADDPRLSYNQILIRPGQPNAKILLFHLGTSVADIE